MSGWARPGVDCRYVGFFTPVPRAPGSRFYPGVVLPQKGAVYRIYETLWCPTYDVLRVCVIGCPNPDATGKDVGWSVEAFRPLVPHKTQEQDMEHFFPLLKTRELVE